MSGAAKPDGGYRDEALAFDSGDARLVGIVSRPGGGRAPGRVGVLVIVGGPQYRVGSHRQFVLLARHLAARGLAVMRFDCAGMGDSDGEPRAFTDHDADIRAAIDAFLVAVPEVAEVALWGLCDAASAALLYGWRDPRVNRMVLLNPWVRSASGLARTHLRHYYTARLRDPAFWSRVFRGRVGIVRALGGWLATWRAARSGAPAASADDSALGYQTRMANGWKRFAGPILLVCAGDDLTAREFLDHSAADAHWTGLLEQARVSRCTLAEADHTFSRAAWRDQVAEWTADWLTARGAPSRERLPAASHEVA